MAILLALRAAGGSLRECIVIFTDSLSVLLALESDRKKSKSYLIWEICKEICKLEGSGKRVTLYWIPAHVGIQGNERADWEAKEACTSGIDTELLIPNTDFKAVWKEELFDKLFEWATLRGRQKGNYYFKWFFEPVRSPWFRRFKNKKLKFSRKELVSVNRLRAGHTTLLECLWQHGIVDSPMCECGEAPQSANHVFWNCPLGSESRGVMLREIAEPGAFGPFMLEPFLQDFQSAAFCAIVSFINTVKFRI